MQPPLPSATPTWHNNTYATISPQRRELSAAGKTVIIIGAGTGIGRETAKAYGSAGAARLVLVGRNEYSLNETASSLPREISSLVCVADVTQDKRMQDVARSVGMWDIIVLCAAYVSDPSPMASANIDEWWLSFETNTKGTFVAIKTFLPTANPSKATILALTTGTTAMPAAMIPGLSAYMASKLAQTKIMEFLAAENPNVFAATVHPGMVETGIFTKSGAKAEMLPMDKVQLPAHFLVWMSSSEAAFLNGRSVWANWDVEELKAQANSIQSGIYMTSGINGWPYTNM
ncbi:short chain dehydrogenase [Pseudomassariella vexata]|uniref:Short chain dehydrogenase n=1 Tax=Pseudomassariella vexata TaxID=1141098 RepID=A0A1Y2E630_9PEZI|nr:short chain dehydrogenase [Pseudomassariella vexata]ORY67018.1 short chain dehydrogenase [Pseudomassariella vexata]